MFDKYPEDPAEPRTAPGLSEEIPRTWAYTPLMLGTGAYGCTGCGAVVIDIPQHDEFHAALSEFSNEAIRYNR